jgi:hypothetical protein
MMFYPNLNVSNLSSLVLNRPDLLASDIIFEREKSLELIDTYSGVLWLAVPIWISSKK